MSIDVAVVRSNPISNDPRAIKIIYSLSKKYRVIVLGWDREAAHKSFEFVGKKIIVKRLKVRAPYGRNQLVLYYPLFWIWVFGNLLIHRPKIIHSCDLDSLIPSYIYKVLFSTKLVFDSFDRYAMAFISPKYYLIFNLVNKLEEVLASKTDILITVSEERLLTFGNYKPNKCEVIMNCPQDKLNIYEYLKNRKRESNKILLVYAGMIARERGLILLSDLIKHFKNMHLILAGRIIDDTYKHLIQNPNVKYVGLLEHDDALKLQGQADIIPILYDLNTPINRVANPNKLFEAMMLGVPVITNVCREIVTQVECGLVVDYDFKSVKDAIYHLKNNPSLGKEMGKNGRLAFEKYYNWRLMDERLMRLYNYILLRS